MLKSYLIQFIIAFIVVTLGLFLFSAHGSFIDDHANLYYFWDKLKDFGFMLCIALLLTGKMKRIAYCITGFLLIRVVWQVWEIENMEQANRPYIIDWLFILLIVSIAINANIRNNKKRHA